MRVFRCSFGALPHLFSSAGLFNWVVPVVDGLWEWRRRHRSRHQRNMMSDHMCKDIGISRADAWRKGRKPFWNV